MKTDPNHESPDLIDARTGDDPTRFDPKPGDPSVKPGILLPTTLPVGWTLGPDGAVVPPPDPEPTPPVTIPEVVITATPPATAHGTLAFVGLLVLAGGLVLWLRGQS